MWSGLFLRGRSDAQRRAPVTDAEIEMAIADGLKEAAALMARQELRAYSRKLLPIGVFMARQARTEAGRPPLRSENWRCAPRRFTARDTGREISRH